MKELIEYFKTVYITWILYSYLSNNGLLNKGIHLLTICLSFRPSCSKFHPIPVNIYIFENSSSRAFKWYSYWLCLNLLIIYRCLAIIFRQFWFRYKYSQYGYYLKALDELISNMYISTCIDWILEGLDPKIRFLIIISIFTRNKLKNATNSEHKRRIHEQEEH